MWRSIQEKCNLKQALPASSPNRSTFTVPSGPLVIGEVAVVPGLSSLFLGVVCVVCVSCLIVPKAGCCCT